MDADSGGVLDASQIEDLRGIDNGGVLAKLVKMYLAKTPERIYGMRSHVASVDLVALAKEAHALKGASGSIGASRVADACQKIEQAILSQDTGPLGELVQALEREFGRARDALQAVL